MACKPCRLTGARLPNDTTCGAPCEDFPACLPEPSPELLASMSRFARQGQAERENHEAVAGTLDQLYRALTEGLDGREHGEDGDC
jgi:hypothetical protein